MCKIEILCPCIMSDVGRVWLIDFSHWKRKNVVNYHLGARDWSCVAFKCSIHKHLVGDSLSTSSHIFQWILYFFHWRRHSTDSKKKVKNQKLHTERNVQSKQKWSLIKRIFCHSHSTYVDVIRLASYIKFTSFSVYKRKMPPHLCSNSCKQQLPNIYTPKCIQGIFFSSRVRREKEISRFYLLNKQRTKP